MAITGCSVAPGASSLPGASGSDTAGSASPASRAAGTALPTGLSSERPSASSSDIFPSELIDATWSVYANDQLVVGSVGATRAITLPPGRQLLAVVGDAIVSSEVADDGSQSTIFLTSQLDGSDIAAATKSPGQIAVGVAAGDHVLATGMDAAGKGDPGVIAISVADGSIEQVIELSCLTATQYA